MACTHHNPISLLKEYAPAVALPTVLVVFLPLIAIAMLALRGALVFVLAAAVIAKGAVSLARWSLPALRTRYHGVLLTRDEPHRLTGQRLLEARR